MAAKRKDDSEGRISESATKLSHLLQTEDELESMLATARQEAKELVEAARVSADERIRQFESQLQSEDDVLEKRVARERDEAIDSIRNEAKAETKRLDEIDDAKVAELAQHVIDLLMGRPGQGDAP